MEEHVGKLGTLVWPFSQSKSVAKIQVREANHTLQHEGQSS